MSRFDGWRNVFTFPEANKTNEMIMIESSKMIIYYMIFPLCFCNNFFFYTFNALWIHKTETSRSFLSVVHSTQIGEVKTFMWIIAGRRWRKKYGGTYSCHPYIYSWYSCQILQYSTNGNKWQSKTHTEQLTVANMSINREFQSFSSCIACIRAFWFRCSLHAHLSTNMIYFIVEDIIQRIVSFTVHLIVVKLIQQPKETRIENLEKFSI